MNRQMLAREIRNWLDGNERAYRRLGTGLFSFTLEGKGRVGFFQAMLLARRGTLQAHFTFPVGACGDETLDLRAALEVMNAALPMGCAAAPGDGSVDWCGGFRADSADDLGASLEALVEYGREIVSRWTEPLAKALLSGETSALPELETAAPEGVELLTEQYFRDQRAGRIGVPPEGGSPEMVLRDRLATQEKELAAVCRRYHSYSAQLLRPVESKGPEELVWHCCPDERLGALRVEVRAEPSVQSVAAILPLRAAEEARPRLQMLLDEMNERLTYGSMRLERASGQVSYGLAVRDQGTDEDRCLVPYLAARSLMEGSADALFRAMLAEEDVPMLVALCREAIEECNAFCKEEGLREVAR